MEIVDKLRALVLKFALPNRQYYIQCDGFHSVFHPIIKPLLSRTPMEDVDGGTNQDGNG